MTQAKRLAFSEIADFSNRIKKNSGGYPDVKSLPGKLT